MADEEKRNPKITLELTDPVRFVVEVALDLPTLQVGRAMLKEAVSAIEDMIQDQKSVEFAAKMEKAAQAQRAISKLPKLQ